MSRTSPRSIPIAISAIAEVRHGMNVKRPKSFRISSGNRSVRITFWERFQTFQQTESELVQEGFLFRRGFGNPAQANLASIPCGQPDVGSGGFPAVLFNHGLGGADADTAGLPITSSLWKWVP